MPCAFRYQYTVVPYPFPTRSHFSTPYHGKSQAIYPRIISLNPLEPTIDSIEHVCERVGAKLTSVTAKECLGFDFFSSGASANGLPILVKEYIERSKGPVKAKVLFVGATHGDEYVAVSVVFKWLRFLEQNTHAFHWKVTPLLNPDGLLRKNSTRTNGNGVDLNRNLPTPNWAKESLAHWINTTNSNPRRFPGSIALSEPENQWLVNEIESFRPQVIITTHAPTELSILTASRTVQLKLAVSNSDSWGLIPAR